MQGRSRQADRGGGDGGGRQHGQRAHEWRRPVQTDLVGSHMEELLALPATRRAELGKLEYYPFTRDRPAPAMPAVAAAGGGRPCLLATVELDTFAAGSALLAAGWSVRHCSCLRLA